MKIISHRGNVEGSAFAENSIEAIDNAIEHGFDVEIDVWVGPEGQIYLGHDSPSCFLKDGLHEFGKGERLWLHCKNVEALQMLRHVFNSFWHDRDRYCLTSGGYIWCYPGQPVPLAGIAVLPETIKNIDTDSLKNCYAVCTDRPIEWRKKLS